MTSNEPPLDEIQWKSPYAAMEMQGIHSNSVLFYFAQSPFFDRTSNNAVLFNQAMFNPNMMPLIQTREAFEGRLKSMTGLEFMVAQEPAEMAPGTGTGVWVIRKQTRRKKLGDESEVTVHSCYFVVGENIYMAPSAADIIASRALTIVSSLNNFFSLASSLQKFSPALGHTYLQPANKSPQTSNRSSRPQVDKEHNSIQALDFHNRSNRLKNQNDTNNFLASSLLEESINICLKYGDECMDENPITGEPGAFHLSSTGRKEKLTTVSQDSREYSQQSKLIPLKTDISPVTKDKKGEKNPKLHGGKSKRKKSRVGNISSNSN